MAVTSIANKLKSGSLLVGNTAYIPPSYESIATISGTGSSGSITFSSIPSTYKHLQLRVFGTYTSTELKIDLRMNGDTASNYNSHWVQGSGASATSTGAYSDTSMAGVGWVVGDSTSSNIGGVAIIDIIDYASTTKYKTVRSFNGQDTNGAGIVRLSSGSWMSTSAVSSLTLLISSGSFKTNAKFALYGIKGA
jgi:hypothetical protein